MHDSDKTAGKKIDTVLQTEASPDVFFEKSCY